MRPAGVTTPPGFLGPLGFHTFGTASFDRVVIGQGQRLRECWW